MVRDAYYYALPLVARRADRLAHRSALGFAGVTAGAFFLWFFRDPDRVIPAEAGALVSPADGKVTDVSPVMIERRAAASHQHYS